MPSVLRILFSLSIVFLAFSSSFSTSSEFERTRSYGLAKLAGELSGLTADDSSAYLMLRETQNAEETWWMLNVDQAVTMSALTEALGIGSILQAQWSHGRALLAGAESVSVFDPSTEAKHTLEPQMPTGNVYMEWSNRHARLVYQTEVLPAAHDTADSQPHAVQTGLALAKDEGYFVTSGFHDHSVRYWSLPEGTLEKIIELDGWFRSKKISAFAPFHDGLVLATHRGTLEWLAHDATETRFSKKLCSSSPAIHALNAPQSNIALYTCPNTAAYGLVSKNTGDAPFVIAELGTMESKTTLDSAHLVRGAWVMLIFNNGSVRLYDVAKQALLTERNFPDALGLAFLPSTGELAYLSSDKTLHLWAVQ